MAGLAGLGVLTVLLSPEPETGIDAAAASATPGDWFKTAVIAPFADFLTRPGWPLILLFIMLYKLGDAYLGVMANPFYVDIGFSTIEIANVSKIFGTIATLVGLAAGGVMVARLGLYKSLLLGGTLQMFSNLMYVLQAWAGHNIELLAATIFIENFSGGLGSAAFVAYLSSLCNVSFTATQDALLSSLAAVGRTTLASSGGWLVDQVGWIVFFTLSTAAAIPGLLMAAWLMQRFRAPEIRPALARD